MAKYTKEQIMNMIVEEAKRQGVDPRLALALAKQESGYNPRVTSSRGAMGVMQLMPNTAKGLGVKDPYDPQQNIRGGIKLLAGLTKKYGSDTKRILAAYNAGSGAVDDYLHGTNKTKQNPKHRKGVMPYDGTGYKETKGYVNNILGMMNDVNSSVNKFIKDHPVIYGATSGAIGGAGLGFAMGGPVGAVGGAISGGITGGIAGQGISKAKEIKDAFERGYAQQSGQVVDPNNTVTGEAAMLPTQGMSGYEAIQNAISLPDIGYKAPTVNPPSGISTATQAQNLLASLPTQYEQDVRDWKLGLISAQQLYALHSDELAKEGINSPKDLIDMPRWTPQALVEANRIANDIKITPEQIQQVQENYNKEIAKQRDMATQQGQGMVDRLNQLQQQYDAIINSDPRLQTGQGYQIDPRQFRNAAIIQASNEGRTVTPQELAQLSMMEYAAQRSNELGIPYDQYLAAKQQAIQNQLAALQQYQQLQGNVNTNQANMVNEISKVVQKANELGIGALTENEKQIVELVKPILQQMTTAEGNMQEKMYERPMQITNANLNTRGNLYQTDVGSMTTTTGDVLSNQGVQQGNAYDYLIKAQQLAEEQRNAPATNYYKYGMGTAGIIQAGQDPSVVAPAFGIYVPPNASLTPTQQPTQGLNWGG